ncbi:MAG TPA: transporter substrate-binding domain-containing protein, partial [Myxococcota bacterium]|nr:transporter substrate-binding domain-containing protein [Myxococcota bacterium]
MNTPQPRAFPRPLNHLWIVLTLLCSFFLGTARAQTPEDTWQKAKTSGTLMWGADQEGGAPYIFPSEENQEVMIGFEVDMAAKMADYMGVKVEFQQSQWDALPSMLQARKVDIVMNGYEWMPDRARDMGVTIPYYVYALQLLVSEKGQIKGWADLEKPKPD